MIRGKGEVRIFNWKTGEGIFHLGLECPKDCDKSAHFAPFTWRDAIDKQMVETGAILAYVARPKEEEELPHIKTLNLTWGI
ncbi:hypothetical protein A3B05_01815 [Candidatus Giovannonibacteria bacterium RIFCSPLOWO2_01_FULL_43_160]|uniref:Uncharacterized protein n=2 Tax=Candidatus Giovannoniibacteriota TaxID=1752738 RepID=A0A0G1IXE2_9BACT|nr:MAG: hypothetical protein UV72_C0002G0142 [Candidatus Giovannonibacteria bacterium GW2011_GWB1_43_13]KKS99932.1 MAG: hypothetical protein UV75_C0001G0097 [Candidatus Giovannonibacteria bacterium GW2011_GWA1_43_15]KKT21008.1 MAG: hypothetical protein UW05_C0020G0003 [Candidatus Giovannonibacteria bacterium GW2011_GWC2_43_8]KKT63633.1 MAG: hypothetical protein UW55_C0002G0098 [Candidatus Giovannonibacteria bacterium GW2011_GWA2_44_26]OGF58491.1 MAG: hypothetical protein A2652_01765 [Candidatus